MPKLSDVTGTPVVKKTAPPPPAKKTAPPPAPKPTTPTPTPVTEAEADALFEKEAVTPAPAKKAAAKKTAAPVKKAEPRTSLLFPALDEEPEHLNVTLYGVEGTGKTTSALSMANLGEGPVLVVNAEGGMRKKALQAQGVNTDNIRFWPEPGVEITKDGLDQLIDQVREDLAENPDAWAGIIIDSGTEIQAVFIDYAMSLRMEDKRTKGDLIKESDYLQTTQGDYGTLAKVVRGFLRKLRDLPCHFVITALERRDVDENTRKVAYGPAVSPSLQSDLMGYVDIVLHMIADEESNTPFVGEAKKRGQYRAKDRTGTLPATLVNPSFERIACYCAGVLLEELDPEQQKLLAQN